MESLLNWVSKCGKAMSRPHGAREATNTLLYRVVFSIFVVGVAILLFPVVKSETGRWTQIHPSHSIESAQWKTLYVDSPSLEKPDSVLFHSTSTRADPEHSKKVRFVIGKPFWIGAQIPSEALREAITKNANRLSLGFISGVYQLWINGELRSSGSYRDARAPIIVSLSKNELESKTGLWIAARIEHTENAITPDYLNPIHGVGLFTQNNSESAQRYLHFITETMHVSFFSISLFFASFFFLFWNADKRKQDYAFISFLASVEAILRLLQTDPVFRVWDLSTMWSLKIVFYVLEGAFGLFLGLSFARTRKEVFHYGIPASIGLAVLTPLWIVDSTAKLGVAAFIASRFVPGLFFLGGLACVLQSAVLSTQGLSQSYPVRRRRLWLFAFGLFAVALLHYGVTQNFGSPQHRTIYDRFLHLFVVTYLGGLLLSDYREQSKKLETLPVSIYHSLTHLPEKLRGWILTIDLKSSNLLLRVGAEDGKGGEYLDALGQEMAIAAEFHGGVITHRVGDELKVFFDESKVASGKQGALAQVLKCTREIEQRLGFRTSRFKSEGVLPETFAAHFRAGAAWGEIRPTWIKGMHTREPGWEEVGSQHVFLAADRLMSLDSQVDPERKRSLLILNRTDAEGISGTITNLGKIADKEGHVLDAVALEMESHPDLGGFLAA